MEDEVGEVRDYLQTLYQGAKESTWSSLFLDKNQALVFGVTISTIVSFLWLVSLFGMWLWSLGPEMSFGTTMFCANFYFTNVMKCHILPGEALSCPKDFQGPTCISWYDEIYPGSTEHIMAMQIVSLLGTLFSFCSTALMLYTLIHISEHNSYHTAIKAAGYLNAIISGCSLATFATFIHFPYANELEKGTNCLVIWLNGKLVCVPESQIGPLPSRGYAFTATVVIFVFSVINTLFFVLSSLKERYSPSAIKED